MDIKHRCFSCGGTGVKEITNPENITQACGDCSGEGFVSYSKIDDLDDLIDKINDIKEKCDEIFDKVKDL